MSERTKRERKSTEHFTPTAGPPEPKKTVILEGSGSKLGEIPNVNFKLDALKSADELLENLHAVLFKSKGKATTRKREVKNFSGFVFPDDSEEAELKKVESKLSKLTLSQLNGLLDVLDIPRGTGEDGTKEKKVDRIVDFLKAPKALSEKDLAAQAAQKKEKAAKAKAKKAKTAPAAKGKVTKKAKVEASKEPAPAKSPTKKEAAKEAAPTKKVVKAAPAKKGTPAAKASKAPAKSPKAKAKETKKRGAAAVSDADQKPAKKAKKADEGGAQWPSDDVVDADVEHILKDAVEKKESVTPNMVYKKLGEKYGMSVAEIKKKKDLIKAAIGKHMDHEDTEMPEAVPEAAPEPTVEATEPDTAEAAVDEEEEEVPPPPEEPEITIPEETAEEAEMQPADPTPEFQPKDPTPEIQPTDPTPEIQPTDPTPEIQATDPIPEVQPQAPEPIAAFAPPATEVEGPRTFTEPAVEQAVPQQAPPPPVEAPPLEATQANGVVPDAPAFATETKDAKESFGGDERPVSAAAATTVEEPVLDRMDDVDQYINQY